MVRKKQRRRSKRVDEDPMAGTANLVDAMLVLAVGFLIFVVMSWNMQSIIFSDMSQQEKDNIMESMSELKQVNQGKELEELPDVSHSSGEGYSEMGKVYKDSRTGKMIMIEG
ncbi:DUF2149 domain-containing protein [Methanosphaera sp. ISO3-F5]|uniref:DUF2149 domain-containing protein n=1 Tax=Methanosphaera sp. ISO3-F5 TaxID=1452353 RepID=UPI002B261910|nr:DUF2149 domain-containing protein [Methanosphaera sp. ISO3-F5]WQH63728.1 DUF2149 domain-containing protein [Methanosphaera sp. ISO3-F5]